MGVGMLAVNREDSVLAKSSLVVFNLFTRQLELMLMYICTALISLNTNFPVIAFTGKHGLQKLDFSVDFEFSLPRRFPLQSHVVLHYLYLEREGP